MSCYFLCCSWGRVTAKNCLKWYFKSCTRRTDDSFWATALKFNTTITRICIAHGSKISVKLICNFRYTKCEIILGFIRRRTHRQYLGRPLLDSRKHKNFSVFFPNKVVYPKSSCNTCYDKLKKHWNCIFEVMLPWA